MKIILIKPVPKLGNAGDVVDVSPGYARNFLLAKGWAQAATAGALGELARTRARKDKEKSQREEKIGKLKNVLAGQTILIRATANPEGVLFGGVDRAQIAAAIAKRKKIQIDPRSINLPHHLKALGKHEVEMKLGGEAVRFFVEVQREEDK